MKPKLIAFLNSYTKGASGGDVRFVEIAKRLDKFDKIVVTSLLGKKFCDEKGLIAKYLITTREKNVKSVVLTYCKRIIQALRLKVQMETDDVIYVTSDFLSDVLPAFFLKLRNKKIRWVQIIHHLIPHFSKRGGSFINNLISYYAQRVSLSLIKHYSDLVIVVNPILKETLIEMGFDSSKIRINPNGIDLNFLRNVKINENMRYDGVFLGRLHTSKGVFDLIRIWKLVSQAKPQAKLAIIGAEDEANIIEKLKKKIKEAHLSHAIDILGYLEDGKAFEVVKSSKVFVFPSHEEGFGIVVLQAMACELVVVTWDLPVYDKIFKKGIIKIPIGDYRSAAREIVKLLEDEGLRKELVSEVEEEMEKYDWDTIAKKEFELITNLGEQTID